MFPKKIYVHRKTFSYKTFASTWIFEPILLVFFHSDPNFFIPAYVCKCRITCNSTNQDNNPHFFMLLFNSNMFCSKAFFRIIQFIRIRNYSETFYLIRPTSSIMKDCILSLSIYHNFECNPWIFLSAQVLMESFVKLQKLYLFLNIGTWLRELNKNCRSESSSKK